MELKLGSALRRAAAAAIGRRGKNGADIVGHLAGFLLGEVAEVDARDLVHLKRKAVSGQLVERGGEFVDGVVGPGQRAVAAAIGGRDLVVGIDLFRGFDVGDDGASVIEFNAAGIGIDDERRIDQVAMIVDQPRCAVEFAAFFIGGERQDQIALRLVALAVKAQEGEDQRGVGVLHVLRAAAVEVAVLLDKLKGIGVPVGGERLDHVDVAEEEDGLFRRWARRRGCGRQGSACSDRDRAGARRRGAKPASRKRFCMAFGRCGHAAFGRVGGVDFDELLEDVAGFGAFRGRRGGQRARLCCGKGTRETENAREPRMTGIIDRGMGAIVSQNFVRPWSVPRDVSSKADFSSPPPNLPQRAFALRGPLKRSGPRSLRMTLSTLVEVSGTEQ